MRKLPPPTAADTLRTIAVSRLMLDNVEHIKAFWIATGVSVAQAALWFGADDLDGTVQEERIYHMAGRTRPTSSPPRIRRLVDGRPQPARARHDVQPRRGDARLSRSGAVTPARGWQQRLACGSDTLGIRIPRTHRGDALMAHTLPALPYDVAALEPHIDAQTMTDPPRQAPPGLRRQPQQGARGACRPAGQVDRPTCCAT